MARPKHLRESRAPMGWTHFFVPGEVFDDLYEQYRIKSERGISAQIKGHSVVSRATVYVPDPRPEMPYDKFLRERIKREASK